MHLTGDLISTNWEGAEPWERPVPNLSFQTHAPAQMQSVQVYQVLASLSLHFQM